MMQYWLFVFVPNETVDVLRAVMVAPLSHIGVRRSARPLDDTS